MSPRRRRRRCSRLSNNWKRRPAKTTRKTMKPRPKIIDRILEAVRDAQVICVVGHIRPDGDCIGSQLGLTLALKAAGKDVTCWNQDDVPDKLRFLDPDKVFEKPKRGRKFDLVIATDAAS